ncbi:MAG: hypothetical protein JST26_01320 [Bacteroidetes bacterium]|nr:hypothetical protein [Bacteroidota bacterium]
MIQFYSPKLIKRSFHTVCLSLLGMASAIAQVSVQNFGTTANSNCSCSSGSTSFIPSPVGSGTTYARTGGGGSPIINLVTSSNPLGSTGAYIKGSASSTSSVTKISPSLGFTGTKVFYAKFKALFGDASGGNTAVDGEWKIFLGSGTMYSDNTDFTGSMVFTGLRFTYGSSGALALSNRNGSNWSTTGITTTSFDQGIYYAFEIIGNNQSSGIVSYTYNGVSQSLATNKFDLYMNGVLIGDDLAAAQLPGNTNINGMTFTGASSTGNAATLYLDDVSIFNAVPATLGGASNPAAFNLASGNYSFNNWPTTSAIGTYPPNMIFHYGDVNQTDPTLSQVNATQDYVYGYNYTAQSRINAKGSNGFSFINTNPGHVSATSGNVGEAVVAVNTTCRNNIQVSWTAGTPTLNSRVYKLRAQYRVGTSGSYTDLPNSSLSQIEYTSTINANTNFGPITLPASCENQPVVQIRWGYYWSSGTSSSRDEINLTNISITSASSIPSVFSVTGGGSYCSGGTGVAIGLNNSSTGVNYQLYRGATQVGSPVAGTGSSISFGNQTTAGTYTVLATNATSSCTAVMSSSAVVTVKPLPTVSSISDKTVCGGKAISTITFSSSPSGATFLWTNTNTSIGLAALGTGNISTYTTPVLSSPPDQTGNIAVIGSLNGCFGSQTTFNITVKGPQVASNWLGAVSSNWNEPDNWSNCVCGTVTNASIAAVSSPSFNPVLTTDVYVNDITLGTGAQLSFTSAETLNVYGNWTNNGAIVPAQGNVNFIGTTQQAISGSTAFYDLTLQNSAGAVLNNDQSVSGTLQLNSGTLDLNSKNLTLLATASSSGRVGPINSAADVNGNITVQQYAQAGYTGWALLGAPFSSALTMSSWNDNFPITCTSCPDGSSIGGSPFTSIYTYDETAAGAYGDAAKYVAINSITDPIVNGVGYWVYLGNGYPNTTGIMFDAKGSIAKSSCLSCSSPVSIPVSYTDHGSPADDGWNLIANPLPSAISWTALLNNNNSVDNAIYAYNTDLNNGAGGFVSYVNNVSSQVGGGINDTIPMCQGVYIHATAATALTAGENTKVNANPTFLRSSQALSTQAKPIVRLFMTGPSGSSDGAVFYFETGATPGFDKHYDAYKLIYDPTLPYLAGVSDTVLTGISGLPDIGAPVVAKVTAITPAANTFTFSAITEHFPAYTCLNLYDTYTGTTTNLLTDSYVCILSDTTKTSRFRLSVGTGTLAANLSVLQPDCAHPHQGLITAVGSNAGPWDFTWKSVTQTVVKNSLQKHTADTLHVLNGGDYTVEIHTSGSCDAFSQLVHVDSMVIPVAQFSLSQDTVYLSSGASAQFTNNTLYGNTYWWNFGDTQNSSFSDPLHTYGAAGVYTVSLISTSTTMCQDTMAQQVVVLNSLITGLGNNSAGQGLVLKSLPANAYRLGYSFGIPADIHVIVRDMNGDVLLEETRAYSQSDEVLVQLEPYASGLYLLEVYSRDALLHVFRLIRD